MEEEGGRRRKDTEQECCLREKKKEGKGQERSGGCTSLSHAQLSIRTNENLKKNFTISTSIRTIIQITTSHVAVRSSPLCVAFTSIMLLCHFSTMLLLLSCTVPSATVPRTTQRFFRRTNDGSRARSVPTAVVRTLRWWW